MFDLAGDVEFFALLGETRRQPKQLSVGLFTVRRSFVQESERGQCVIAIVDAARGIERKLRGCGRLRLHAQHRSAFDHLFEVFVLVNSYVSLSGFAGDDCRRWNRNAGACTRGTRADSHRICGRRFRTRRFCFSACDRRRLSRGHDRFLHEIGHTLGGSEIRRLLQCVSRSFMFSLDGGFCFFSQSCALDSLLPPGLETFRKVAYKREPRTHRVSDHFVKSNKREIRREQ